MRVEEENPGRRVSGLENWGTVRKQGRGFFGVGSQAPPPPAAHTQPTRKMSRRNEWMGKGGAAQVLGVSSGLSFYHQRHPQFLLLPQRSSTSTSRRTASAWRGRRRARARGCRASCLAGWPP